MSGVTVYQIQVITKDRGGWEAVLRHALKEELAESGLHKTIDVQVGSTIPSPDNPSVAVYLGSVGAAGDGAVVDAVVAAFGAARVVLPVVEDLNTFSASVPSVLRGVNGLEWPGDGRAVARRLLEELGIQERQRKVFISHKRTDGLWAAEQVYDALAHAGFTPFVDRFCIPPGVRVQEAIADVLEEHAFLLLLETPKAHESAWVFDEVDYALGHAMGILIVSWPSRPTAVPGSERLPRMVLRRSDLRTSKRRANPLKPATVARLVENVERAHAQGLCRRRRNLVQDVHEAAFASGASACVPLPGWRLKISHPSKTTFVGVTPRLPNVMDLQGLDEIRNGAATDASALLVHSARQLRPDLYAHLAWAVADRDLALTPSNAIGSWW